MRSARSAGSTAFIMVFMVTPFDICFVSNEALFSLVPCVKLQATV